MVKKTDWKTIEMPEQRECFIFERKLTADELEQIKEGHIPQEMEDKWFMYYQEGKLFIHRSWTGFCIYIVDISEDGRMRVVVNRNPEQYKEKDIERDKLMLNILINNLIKQNGANARLMKAYIEYERRKRHE